MKQSKGRRPISKDEFIERATKRHGNKYDYSISDFKNMSTPIKIMHPVHGEFTATPKNHIAGSKHPIEQELHSYTTPKRVMVAKKKKATKGTRPNGSVKFYEFVSEKFPVYDFSKSVYVDRSTPMTIICPEHGEFQSAPSSIKKSIGCGCRKCARPNEIDYSTMKVSDEERMMSGISFDMAGLKKLKEIMKGNMELGRLELARCDGNRNKRFRFNCRILSSFAADVALEPNGSVDIYFMREVSSLTGRYLVELVKRFDSGIDHSALDSAKDSAWKIISSCETRLENGNKALHSQRSMVMNYL